MIDERRSGFAGERGKAPTPRLGEPPGVSR